MSKVSTKEIKFKREWQTIIVLATLIAVNLGLAIGKLYIGIATYSLPIMIDATNNFFDVLSAIIIIMGFIFMMQREKTKNINKNGRAEYVVNFLSTIILIGIALMFLYFSAVKLNLPAPPSFYSTKYLIVLFMTAIVKILMGLIALLANKKIGASALSVVMVDNFVDAGMTTFVAISFIAREKGSTVVIDGIFGIILSLASLALGIKMLIPAWGKVLGYAVDKDTNKILVKIKNVIPNRRCEGLELHDYGEKNIFAKIKVYVNEEEAIDFLQSKEDLENQLEEEVGIRVSIETILECDKIEESDASHTIEDNEAIDEVEDLTSSADGGEKAEELLGLEARDADLSASAHSEVGTFGKGKKEKTSKTAHL